MENAMETVVYRVGVCKVRGTFFRVPIIRIIVCRILVSILGSPCFGKLPHCI